MADIATYLRISPVEHVPGNSVFIDFDYTEIRGIGQFCEIFFQVQEACIITRVGFNVQDGAVAGVGTLGAATCVATLQGISAAGIGDGVIKATTANYTPNASAANEFNWIALIAGYSAQRGERLCLRLEQVGGGGTSFGTRILNYGTFAGGFPYQRVGSVASNKDASIQVFGYGSSTKSYGLPLKKILRESTNSPGKTGMRFLLPTTYGSSAVLSHITWLGLPSQVAERTYDVVVYDDNEQEVSRTRFDVNLGALNMSATTAGRDYSSTCYLEEAPVIEFGREYFVMLAPGSSTQGLAVSGWEFPDATDAAALGLGGEFFQAADGGILGGGFSKNQNVRPMIDLGFYDWGISAAPRVGYHVKFVPRYNDNVLIEHADDQIADPNETVEGLAFEAPGFPIGGSIKSYGGFATVEVFRNPSGQFDSTTRIFTERPIETLKIVNWDPFVEGESVLVFRLRAATGSSAFVDVYQYARLIL